MDHGQLLTFIQEQASSLGFSQIGVASVDLSSAEPGLLAWLASGYHGDMAYMAEHGLRRARPAELVPGTVSVITVRMDYLPRDTPAGWQKIEFDGLNKSETGVVSMYARGRDYHKVLRKRLQTLATRLEEQTGPLVYRAFTDSAPVLEAELATRSGQGWRGKHSLVLNREAGSMFFLGELFINRELPETSAVSDHCGSCDACMRICPTQAIVAPYRVDARRCISYLTIEHAGSIPEELRPLMGNHIYGCDDCQLVCPWNKFAKTSTLADFDPRSSFLAPELARLLTWTEEEFLRYTEGGPIRRIGHERWLRNVAVASGNALSQSLASRSALIPALAAHLGSTSPLVLEHVQWALAQSAVTAPNSVQKAS